MAARLDTTLAACIGDAAEGARRHARTFSGPEGRDALPWAVIEGFDAAVRGNLERDRRIEEERDRVLIAAVDLAEAPPEDADAVAGARAHLLDAVDYLEQAVLRFGRVNGRGAKLGLAQG